LVFQEINWVVFILKEPLPSNTEQLAPIDIEEYLENSQDNLSLKTFIWAKGEYVGKVSKSPG
jgi:hypothetical protein